MSQCYAVPPLERRERPVWQAGLALSASRRRPAARGPNHDTNHSSSQLRWQRALVVWQAKGRLNGMARIACARPRAQRAAL